MEENVHCPRCSHLLIKQIEPLHGSIQMLCVKCRTNLILTFDNGKLINVIYVGEEEMLNDKDKSQLPEMREESDG